MNPKNRASPPAPRLALLLIGGVAIFMAALAVAALIWDRAKPRGTGAVIAVYKHPECNCCNKWIDHLEANGFVVEGHRELKQAERQASLGVPKSLRACHTAVVEGYVVEGHVPAGDIQRLLRDRPQAVGIAVPGMPIGSPGMEQGERHDVYDVLLFDRAGQTTVFARHGEPASATEQP